MAFDSEIFWHRTAQANKVIRNTARRCARGAASNLTKMGVGDTGALAAHIKSSTTTRDGLVIRIGMQTFRYGIMRDMGAGRGWPGGKQVTQNSKKPRTPAPWLSSVFEKEAPKLADQLSKIKGDDMVDELDERFKGTLRDKYRIS